MTVNSSRKYRVVTLSLPPELADEVERVAAEEARTRSELFREMIRVYLARRRGQSPAQWSVNHPEPPDCRPDVSRETSEGKTR